MSDIIRMARAMYGQMYDRLAADAGRTKAEYVASGGNPDDVYSPERLAELMSGGPMALVRSPTTVRDDSSVAGPYVPTQLALAMNMVEPMALPAVLDATNRGIRTVSSGVDRDTGKGFAIGKDPNGNVVKLLR